SRVGASDDLGRGQSTFMVEMNETSNIVNNATECSLVILDEIGRGTSTFDGLSIAWSVAEFLHDRIKARTLFATHYHELTKLAAERKGVCNFNVAVREWNDQIIFLRKIVPGGADKSYGIQVARLAGLPKEILDRAKEILSHLENPSNATAEPKPRERKSSKGRPQSQKPQLDLWRDQTSLNLARNDIKLGPRTPVDAHASTAGSLAIPRRCHSPPHQRRIAYCDTISAMAVKTEKELNDAQRNLWLKAVAAVELRNLGYAISLLQEILKQEPQFLMGRQLLRRAEVTKNRSTKRNFFNISTAPIAIMKAQREIKKNPKRAIEMLEKVLEEEPYNRQ